MATLRTAPRERTTVLPGFRIGRDPAGVEGRGPRVSRLAALALPSVAAAIFAVALLHVLFIGEGTRMLFRDSDTGWHIRNGEAMLRSHSVPRADPFSYTHAGREWFAWEWLADAALGAVHRGAGPAGVAFLAALIIALAAWGSARLALSLGGNIFYTAAVAVPLLGATSIHWLARPHIFSWVLALAFVALAERMRMQVQSPKSKVQSPSHVPALDFGLSTLDCRTHLAPRTLFLAPLLACLWANLHGSFLLGPAILACYAIGADIERFLDRKLEIRNPHSAIRNSSDAQSASRYWLACLLSLAATFINPYGWRVHQHVFAYLRNTYLMDHISEFRSFNFHGPQSGYVELFLLVAVAGGFALLRQRAFGAALLTFGLLHASIYSARHLPTAAVVLLPLAVAALTRESEAVPALRRFIEYSRRVAIIDRRVIGAAPVLLAVLVSAVALAGMSRAGPLTGTRQGVGFNPAMFPVQACAWLESRGYVPVGQASTPATTLRVFAKDQYGGYLIYRFNGRLKVFVDGRSDFYGRDMLERYAQVVEVKPGWETVLRQEGVQLVLIPTEHVLASALSLRPEWKRIYADSVATIFERLDAAEAHAILPAAGVSVPGSEQPRGESVLWNAGLGTGGRRHGAPASTLTGYPSGLPAGPHTKSLKASSRREFFSFTVEADSEARGPAGTEAGAPYMPALHRPPISASPGRDSIVPGGLR